ncbi:hypothetical protein DL770_005165 [Monosporascus sp. CRB-9-2]|nr:hypothetical protein DL770_005165 [Monosporascus sp. CRB-9-2]
MPDDNGLAMGILLTYIDHSSRPLSTEVDPDHRARARGASPLPPPPDDNARITDFDDGYTQGWVDEQMTGTVEGDLAGMAKLREFIFQGDAQGRWWTG